MQRTAEEEEEEETSEVEEYHRWSARCVHGCYTDDAVLSGSFCTWVMCTSIHLYLCTVHIVSLFVRISARVRRTNDTACLLVRRMIPYGSRSTTRLYVCTYRHWVCTRHMRCFLALPGHAQLSFFKKFLSSRCKTGDLKKQALSLVAVLSERQTSCTPCHGCPVVPYKYIETKRLLWVPTGIEDA